MRFRRAVLVLSSLLIAAGAGLIAFPLLWVGYTALYAGPTQAAALAAWEQPASAGGAPQASAAGSQPMPADSAAKRPSAESIVLSIPRLGVRRFVPEGATVDQMRRYGLGRISWTALPDGGGIVAIAGHRTTYGAPFFRLDRLRAGDRILIDYAGKRYAYSVTDRLTVRPSRVDVLRASPGQRSVALVTCTPVYSAAYRLVVLGRLDEVTTIAVVR